MTSAELAAIRARHVRVVQRRGEHAGFATCECCIYRDTADGYAEYFPTWPCDTVVLLSEINRLQTAMRSALGVLDELAKDRPRRDGQVPVTLATVTGAIADDLRRALGEGA